MIQIVSCSLRELIIDLLQYVYIWNPSFYILLHCIHQPAFLLAFRAAHLLIRRPGVWFLAAPHWCVHVRQKALRYWKMCLYERVNEACCIKSFKCYIKNQAIYHFTICCQMWDCALWPNISTLLLSCEKIFMTASFFPSLYIKWQLTCQKSNRGINILVYLWAKGSI